jgi:hypothetical protein
VHTTAIPGITASTMARLFPEVDEHLNDPVGWVDTRLKETLWSKQREIAESVRDNRYTAVESAHDTGKSFIASRLVTWWLEAHAPGDAFAVTTAPTQTQVGTILWREIGRAHAKGNLSGRIGGGMVPTWKLDSGEIVGYGRKPQDLANEEEAAAAFSGIHARFVLVILDEADGIPKWLWDAVDTLATNESARVLAIGNPDAPDSHFAKVCQPGSGWVRHRISAFDTPAFTGEKVPDELLELLVSRDWVEERKRRWGERSAMYLSKVLGQRPEASESQLITAPMVRAAQALDLSGQALADPGTYGWDIGEFGSDESAGYLNRGGMVRHVYTSAQQDVMATTGDIVAEVDGKTDRMNVVDKVGVGSGVWARLRELGVPVHGFGAGERAHDPLRFVNRRAEAWWAVREAMRENLVDLDPEDEELAAELQAPRWGRDSRGRVWIESKESLKKRGVASPNRADAVIQSFVHAAGADEPGAPAVVDVHESVESLTAGVLTEPM